MFAAPIADFIAMIVAAVLTVTFMRSLKEVQSEERNEDVLEPSKHGAIISINREHGSSTCGTR